ncbi:hypothetical protein [Aminipila luticellarii]|uniref:Uncharacterized protein n=1 Tax=Aminipila luticellarii TaxID=2507160 RepID=A0A410PWW6_9FIRM|nr:hypothetical protein [Aminipila luticellarii]QAT43431.1 hypothetical protein EQM06_09510 [Aminipila luticellarii]
MKKVIKIDENGLFVEDVIIQDGEKIPTKCIETLCSDGFYKPKWDGSKWVEGLSEEEINALVNIIPEPTEAERLASAEKAIAILMGV